MRYRWRFHSPGTAFLPGHSRRQRVLPFKTRRTRRGARRARRGTGRTRRGSLPLQRFAFWTDETVCSSQIPGGGPQVPGAPRSGSSGAFSSRTLLVKTRGVGRRLPTLTAPANRRHGREGARCPFQPAGTLSLSLRRSAPPGAREAAMLQFPDGLHEERGGLPRRQ